MAKIVKMDQGDAPLIDIYQELDKWETYDFVLGRWLPASKFTMFWPNPFPYPEGSFDAALQTVIDKHLPADDTAILYAYDSNESFGVLRPKLSR